MSDKEIYDLASSLMQNPDPFLRLSIYGQIILKNPAAENLTEFYYQGNKFKAGDFWRFIAKKGSYIYEGATFEVNADGKTYSFACKYFALPGYFNLYGRDVTLQKQKEAD